MGTVTTDADACASITFSEAGTYYLWVDGGYGNEYPDSIVSAPGFATVTVTEAAQPDVPETPDAAQDVSAVLKSTMAQLAASVNLNGALHKSKSTENSRLIVALWTIGKDATSVGDWDLVEAYSANGFSWIKKQGLNGTIWALIALDSNNYETSDATIRRQCIDSILSLQHDDGGWALQANKTYASDPDITGMALTALYSYRDQPEVAAACAEAFACLSAMQHDNGTFASGGSECAESCPWVIVSTTTWGINPDTDSRFIKNGNSVVDALLAHYLEDEKAFQHVIGAGSNAMATDQAWYGLVAYDRFLNGKAALYDYSDVTFDAVVAPESDEMTAAMGVAAEVEGTAGTEFNAVISINKWDNEAGYKIIDFIMTVPAGLSVTNVTAGDRLTGGEVSWNLEAETGKLRVVYFDANENSDLTISGTEFPAELFTIDFKLDSDMTAGNPILNHTMEETNMSEKLKLCVDVGHSGAYYNAGAAAGYYESAQMWKLGKYLIPELESYGIEVVPTRTKRDVDLDLEVRGRKAKGCAGLVSLHSNAADSKKTNYVVAMHQVDDNCGKMDKVSEELANRLANCVSDVMGAKAQTWSTKSGHDRDKNGYKDDYYGVLRGAHSVGVPAVIIEHGFHTNPAQAAWLMKNANLRKLAKAEAETIADFYGVTKTKEFGVRIRVKTLRVRSGAGTEHQIVTKVKRGEVYTITKTNEAGTWGRLKSGAGWICITPTYVERV